MVDPHPNNTDQLTTSIDRPQVWPLVIAPVPFLRASFHLSHVVGRQGQMLETTTSGYRTSRNEVVQGESIKSMESTPQTLNSLIDCLSRRVNPVRIVSSGPSVLDVVLRLKVLEALHTGIVDILGVGDELGRRRSVGGRHFEWRMGR